jgi:hypothetical protein
MKQHALTGSAVEAQGCMKAHGALGERAGLVDDETILRLMLQALGVEDIDELVDLLQQTKLEKENGGTLGNLVADAFRKGQDPAALLRGGATPPVPPGPTPPAPEPVPAA